MRSHHFNYGEGFMNNEENGCIYRGYQLDVTRRRDSKSMLWKAHFRVGGKLGTLQHGSTKPHADFIVAEAEAAERARLYIDMIIDEIPLGTAAA